MSSINGVGTTLYGKTDTNPNDKSYIATEWFIVLFLPIVPIGSYRVWREKTISSASALLGVGVETKTQYRMVKVKMNWKQVAKTYLFAFIMYIFFVSILALILANN